MKFLIVILTVVYCSLCFAKDPFTFMQGCWEKKEKGALKQETWGGGEGGLYLGYAKNVNDGAISFYEFLKIEKINGKWIYRPYLKGVGKAPFLLKYYSEGRVEFENLKNDYPQKIVYSLKKNQIKVALSNASKKESYFLKKVKCL